MNNKETALKRLDELIEQACKPGLTDYLKGMYFGIASGYIYGLAMANLITYDEYELLSSKLEKSKEVNHD